LVIFVAGSMSLRFHLLGVLVHLVAHGRLRLGCHTSMAKPSEQFKKSEHNKHNFTRMEQSRHELSHGQPPTSPDGTLTLCSDCADDVHHA
jgi:hypothetical protein